MKSGEGGKSSNSDESGLPTMRDGKSSAYGKFKKMNKHTTEEVKENSEGNREKIVLVTANNANGRE